MEELKKPTRPAPAWINPDEHMGATEPQEGLVEEKRHQEELARPTNPGQRPSQRPTV
jgi:hypothetical protein